MSQVQARESPMGGHASRAVAGSWSEHEIDGFSEDLLIDTMRRAVDGRATQATKAQAWTWVNDDSMDAFSFRACALRLGLDPDELREQFLAESARLRLR